MKRLVFLCVCVLALAACGQASTSNVIANVQMALRVEPDPPAVGASTLIVTLKDGNGAPVDGATVHAHADMEHAGMMPLDSEVATSSSGEYRLPLEWSMGGGWIVTVTAKWADGSTATQNFTLEVSAVSSESIINQNKGHS